MVCFLSQSKCFPVYLPGCLWPFHSICAFWCFLLLQPPSTCQKCHPGLCLCIQPWSGQTLPAVSPRQPKRRPSLVGKTDSRCAHCGQYFVQFCSFLPRIKEFEIPKQSFPTEYIQCLKSVTMKVWIYFLKLNVNIARLKYARTVCTKEGLTSRALCGSCLSVHCFSLMSTVVLKVPESIVWAAGK